MVRDRADSAHPRERSSAPPRRERVLIGTSEIVAIPAWGIRGLAAKIDTGARTSALHVERVKELPAGRVRFDVCLEADAPEKRVRVEAAVERRGRVRASNGGVEIRVFVGARIALGGVERRIEIGLVDRSEMLYRMLLGRSALAGSFLVDPGRRYVFGR